MFLNFVDSLEEVCISSINAINDSEDNIITKSADDVASYPIIFSIDHVPFPGVNFVMYIAREKSVNAVECALSKDKKIFVCMQKTPTEDYPNIDEVHQIGVVCRIKEFVRKNGYFALLLEGLYRARIISYAQKKEKITFMKKNVEDSDVKNYHGHIVEKSFEDIDYTHDIYDLESFDLDMTDSNNNNDSEEILDLKFKDISDGEKDIEIGSVQVIELHSNLSTNDMEYVAEIRDSLMDEFINHYCRVERKISSEAIAYLKSINSIEKIVHHIANYIVFENEEKQNLLEENDVLKKARDLLAILKKVLITNEERKKINEIVQRNFDKMQRDMILRQQKDAIEKELEDGNGEFSDIQEQIKKAKMPEEVDAKIQSEFSKLKQSNPMSAEASVSRSYIEYVTSMPWNEFSDENKDIAKAEVVLNSGHHSMQEVKDRILEYISVQNRVNAPAKTVLCLIGAPGVGKTSLAKSIAKALNRPFISIPLGGVSDESEIRGHKKTYIGAMPGKIVAGLKKVKVKNPVILLDEVDKISRDYRGDPASALLEVLDPEQNTAFQDNYLDVPFDLSKVLFICTANSHIDNGPLADRMEQIHIPGYTNEEKFFIAKNHLMNSIYQLNGLNKNEFTISDAAIKYIIEHYTREAGVRNLDRLLSKIARKIVFKLMKKEKSPDSNETKFAITPKDLTKYLGAPIFDLHDKKKTHMTGVVNGLAWTQHGGEVLTIEAYALPGKGNIRITGNLGKVMEESVQAARSFVFANAEKYGIKKNINEVDLHVHVPNGAVPKDGPSAGIAMIVCILSALTDLKVNAYVGMTGEMSFRGSVLAIGGLKEKILGAIRDGLKTVLIPYENRKDLEKIEEKIKKQIEIVLVRNVDEAIERAIIVE